MQYTNDQNAARAKAYTNAELIQECDGIARLMDAGAVNAINAAPIIGELVARFTAMTAGVTVTLDMDTWGDVLDALDAYQNDEDARADYPAEAAALDGAAAAIISARMKYAKDVK